MADYRLTSRCDHDLAEIAEYSIESFGLARARRYLEDLESCFSNLAANPLSGQAAEALSPGLRFLRHASHVVFYHSDPDGVLIVRVLHKSMSPEKHL